MLCRLRQYFLTDKRTATAFDNLLLLINLINAVNYQIDMIDKLWLYDMQAILLCTLL